MRPIGAPCWIDLWTSDVEGSRAFYGELFGWVAEQPSEEFGGYFMFTHNGVPTAGGMGDMGEAKANDTWKVYLTSPDATKTVAAAEAEGGQTVGPAMPVADLGVQAVLLDPTGATVGVWEPRSFPGLTVFNEPGTPAWFELHTRDHGRAVAFYSSVFQLESNVVGDSDQFRYATLRHGDTDLAGIMDASGFLVGEPRWSVYFAVADADATAARARSLGGSVVLEPENTPYGRLATLEDPAGAEFKLHQG